MALSGSINIEGLEITGSYTNIQDFVYKKKNEEYSIIYNYSIYVDEPHRDSGNSPLHKGGSSMVFETTGSVDPFYWMYNHLRTQPYFISGSLIDC